MTADVSDFDITWPFPNIISIISDESRSIGWLCSSKYVLNFWTINSKTQI